MQSAERLSLAAISYVFGTTAIFGPRTGLRPAYARAFLRQASPAGTACEHRRVCKAFPAAWPPESLHRSAILRCGGLVRSATERRLAETEGFEPSVREFPVRRFSKPLVSATHPRLRMRSAQAFRGRPGTSTRRGYRGGFSAVQPRQITSFGPPAAFRSSPPPQVRAAGCPAPANPPPARSMQR